MAEKEGVEGLIYHTQNFFYCRASRGKRLIYDFLQTAPPRGASGGGAILSPQGALTCLYGVTYSRASPRLQLGVIFVFE